MFKQHFVFEVDIGRKIDETKENTTICAFGTTKGMFIL